MTLLNGMLHVCTGRPPLVYTIYNEHYIPLPGCAGDCCELDEFLVRPSSITQCPRHYLQCQSWLSSVSVFEILRKKPSIDSSGQRQQCNSPTGL